MKQSNENVINYVYLVFLIIGVHIMSKPILKPTDISSFIETFLKSPRAVSTIKIQ